MAKKKPNKLTDATEILPNNAPVNPSLVTMSDYYRHYYKVLFDKLNKESQESIVTNSAKPLQIVRGNVTEFADVREFIKAVVENAETAYDKAQTKKKETK